MVEEGAGMSGTVVVILAIVALLGPILTAVVTYWLGRRTKADDYARQDAVAAKVAGAATKLLEADQKRGAAEKVVVGKLEQIHGLVNSKMTEQMELLRVAWEVNLALLRRDPSSDPEVIETLAARLTQLQASLAERAEQSQMASAEV